MSSIWYLSIEMGDTRLPIEIAVSDEQMPIPSHCRPSTTRTEFLTLRRYLRPGILLQAQWKNRFEELAFTLDYSAISL
jgi:hypothetical protein